MLTKSHAFRIKRSSLRLAYFSFLFILIAILPIGSKAQITGTASQIVVGVLQDNDNAAEATYMATVGTVLYHDTYVYAYRLQLAKGVSVSDVINQLVQRPEVRYAEPVHYITAASVPNDPFYNNKDQTVGDPRYNLIYQYGPQQIQANYAWSVWSPQSTKVIAIIDTGITNTHPDLTNKIFKDSSGNIMGYNAITDPYPNDKQSDAADDNGHGTHCAGIAAAQINNSTGMAGICGWNGISSSTDTSYTKLMPVKTLDSRMNGTNTELGDGIQWAVDNGANILSISIIENNHVDDSYVRDKISYAWGKGVLIVAAAGNDGGNTKNYPAADANVISVAASDSIDTLAGFSSYGSWVLVSAPGGQGSSINNPTATEEIYSCWLNNGYAWDWGTSMATPHVSGEAALLWSQNPSLTNSQISSYITSNWDSVTPYTSGNTIAGGRINAFRALERATGAVVAVGDFNGDGKPDLVFQTNNIVDFQILNGSTITGTANTGSTTVPSGWQVCGAGDFNGDGKTDLVLENLSTGKVAFWLMNGTTPTSGVNCNSTQATGWKICGVGDFNGDGKPDIVWETLSTGQIAFWFMNGTNTTGGAYCNDTLTSGWQVVGVGDFNADGKPDLVLENPTTGQIAFWFMNGTNTTNGAYCNSTLPSTWNVVGVGDVNGDGKPDLLNQSLTPGTVASPLADWIMNGTNTTTGYYILPSS